MPSESEYCKSNWQSYPVRILDNSPLSRDELMQYLLDSGISTRRGIMNIHQEKPYVSQFSLENSESSRDSVILLPVFQELTHEQIDKITKLLERI
jgi:dTDP-4-amino-4,6-dideoxygalactose transaminase